MQYIRTILKKIFQKELPKPIGRWRIEHCNKQMNNKIDLSNEDHCGPCGQYALTKIEFKKPQYENDKRKVTYLEKPNNF
jgi:hypothetical protein